MKCCDSIAIVLIIIAVIHSGSTRPNGPTEAGAQTENPLEEVRIRELVAAADGNETYAKFAVEAFERKHAHRSVRFDSLREKTVSWLLPIQIIDGPITIRQFDVALTFLKHFGHLVSWIEVQHSDLYVANIDPKNFYDHINLYCADNLEILKLNTFDEHLFAGMTKPFTKVQSVSIGGRFESFASETLSFSQLFPNIRELNLIPDKIVDKSLIDLTLQNLESLSIAFYHNVFSEDDIEKFLRKNSQIRKLSVTFSSPKFIQTINEVLPNITHLNLLDYNRKNEVDTESAVTFKHVVSFTVSMRLGNLPQHIFFENLKELLVNSYENHDWQFLVERNPQLEKLTFENGLIYNEQFEKIIASNLNLREVSLNIDHDVTDANVLNFVRNHKNANRIYFRTWGKHLTEYYELGQALLKELGDAFQVRAGENVLIVERV